MTCCCWPSRPSNLSPWKKSRRSRCFWPPIRPSRSPAPTSRWTAAGPPPDPKSPGQSRARCKTRPALACHAARFVMPVIAVKPAPDVGGSNRKKINLALQGGGAHGAFTWGVLDILLEDGRFDFDGLSGASAGAMNAICFAEGMRKGGKEGARKQLAHFWRSASLDGALRPVQRDVFEGLLSFWGATPAS